MTDYLQAALKIGPAPLVTRRTPTTPKPTPPSTPKTTTTTTTKFGFNSTLNSSWIKTYDKLGILSNKPTSASKRDRETTLTHRLTKATTSSAPIEDEEDEEDEDDRIFAVMKQRVEKEMRERSEKEERERKNRGEEMRKREERIEREEREKRKEKREREERERFVREEKERQKRLRDMLKEDVKKANREKETKGENGDDEGKTKTTIAATTKSKKRRRRATEGVAKVFAVEAKEDESRIDADEDDDDAGDDDDGNDDGDKDDGNVDDDTKEKADNDAVDDADADNDNNNNAQSEPLPSLNSVNIDYTTHVQRLRRAKEIVKLAAESNSVFLLGGNGCFFVRESMRRRGWVEKVTLKAEWDDVQKQVEACLSVESFYGPQRFVHRRHLFQNALHSEAPATTPTTPSPTPPQSPRPSMVGAISSSLAGVKLNNAYRQRHLGLVRQLYRTEVAEMTNLVRSYVPNFFWTSGRSQAMYQLLDSRPDIVWNHFASSGGSFTTKEGLCSIMRDINWRLDFDKDEIVPRVYRLSKFDDKLDFIIDFKVTACANLLKHIVENYPVEEDLVTPSGGAAQKRADPSNEAIMSVAERALIIQWQGDRKTVNSFGLGSGDDPARAVLNVNNNNNNNAVDDVGACEGVSFTPTATEAVPGAGRRRLVRKRARSRPTIRTHHWGTKHLKADSAEDRPPSLPLPPSPSPSPPPPPHSPLPPSRRRKWRKRIISRRTEESGRLRRERGAAETRATDSAPDEDSADLVVLTPPRFSGFGHPRSFAGLSGVANPAITYNDCVAIGGGFFVGGVGVGGSEGGIFNRNTNAQPPSLVVFATPPSTASTAKTTQHPSPPPSTPPATPLLGISGVSTTTGVFTAPLSQRIVELACIQLETLLSHRNHEDIDKTQILPDVTGAIAERAWPRLLKYIQDITSGTRTLDLTPDSILRCRVMLQAVRPLMKQQHVDGTKNMWILKPPSSSRGRGIVISQNLDEILKVSSSSRVVCQKYIERPMTIYDTKFDIRQWFLITSWNPLTLWWYNDCYVRFSSQIFDLKNFDESIHLTNNAIQANYKNHRHRSSLLPEENMWDAATFAQFCKTKADGVDVFRTITVPKMKKHITGVMTCATEFMVNRHNSFELYGADYMVDAWFHPWLLEVNASPALGGTTKVTKRLCRAVIEDAMKVVLDRKKNPEADTGKFELVYQEKNVNMNKDMNSSALLKVSGTTIPRPSSSNHELIEERKYKKLAPWRP